MKNTIKAFGLIVLSIAIGFSFIACGGGGGDDGGNPGKLTITGLDDFNGKYACAEGLDLPLFAAKSINFSRREIVCERINGGSVVLNVWELNSSETNVVEYNGSDNTRFSVVISDKEKLDVDYDEGFPPEGMVTVAFKNGTASGVFVERSSW